MRCSGRFKAELLNALHQLFGYLLGCCELLSSFKHPALCVRELVRGTDNGRNGQLLGLPSCVGLNAYIGSRYDALQQLIGRIGGKDTRRERSKALTEGIRDG